MERRKVSYSVGGNVSWCSHYGKQYGGSSEKPKIELPYDPAVSLLGIYSGKSIIQKDTCISMFIATPFTIAKTWKQLKCPSRDEWIKKTYVYRRWYIYTMENYWAIKRTKIMPLAATRLQLEIIIRSEVSQSEKDKYHTISLYVESKIWYKWTYLQNRNRLTDIENRPVVTKEGVGKGEEYPGSLKLVDANYYISNGWTARS